MDLNHLYYIESKPTKWNEMHKHCGREYRIFVVMFMTREMQFYRCHIIYGDLHVLLIYVFNRNSEMAGGVIFYQHERTPFTEQGEK